MTQIASIVFKPDGVDEPQDDYLRVDLEEVCRKFSLPFNSFDEYITKLNELHFDGVVRVYDRFIVIMPEYAALARVVCEVFDMYSVEDQPYQRHARAI